VKVFAVSMVKDEQDIIQYTIENLIARGVDHILINDNLSSDGTTEILQDFETRGLITVYEDKEVGYYQSDKMTDLARKAFDQGADWVIPFDADEYWSVPSTFHSFFSGITQSCCQFKLFNYFPTSNDKHSERNPFLRITNRSIEPAPLYKVAVRNVGNLVIHQGNHSATGDNMTYMLGNGMIGHFPWRSYEQFRKKVINGYKAYAASTLPEDMGSHWRSYGQLFEAGGDEALKGVFEKWFSDPEEGVMNAPVSVP